MRWKRRTQTRVGRTRQLGKAAILGEEATLSKNLNRRNRMTQPTWRGQKIGCLSINYSMAVQLSLDRCGVVLVGRSQGGTAPGPQPQRGPTNATDCGSDPLLMAGGGQSRATGHQTLRIVHWNAEGVRQKKLELQQFLKAQKIDVCCIQETHLNNTHRFSIRGYEIH